MKKKILAMVIAMTMILSIIPTATVTAEDPVEIVVGHTDGTVTADDVDNALAEAGLITGPGEWWWEVWERNYIQVVPFTVTFTDGVTSIGNSAFEYYESLTAVTIPNGVTSIGISAFSRCRGLTSVTIPNGVTDIGMNGFAYCTKLAEIIIPDSVTNIDVQAFSGCTSLTSIEIPSKVTVINEGMLRGCESLTSITIPDSVTSIDDFAFLGCTSLTAVTIPKGVTSIGNGVFSDCATLESINADIANENYSSENGILFNKSKTELIQYPVGKADTSYSVPDGVTGIGAYAFNGCVALETVTVPNSVTNIEQGVFWNCEALTTVTLGSGVTIIDGGMFYNCKSLENINVDSANQNYSSENGVLFNKDKTELIKYPVGRIGTSYSIPAGVTIIGGSAFSYCESLIEITIPNTVTTIGGQSFFYCTGLTSVTIPVGVTSIGAGAFRGCTSLVSVTIPNTVTSIEGTAFNDCSSLTSVTIPDSVTSIGVGTYSPESVFSGCTNLTTVIIGKNVTKIGSMSFSGCTNLTSVTFRGSTPPEFGFSYGMGGGGGGTVFDVFYNCPALKTIYVPIGAKAAYEEVSAPMGEWSLSKYDIVDIEVTDNITAPSVPRNLVATPGNGQVTISWDAPEFDGGGTELWYHLGHDDGGSGNGFVFGPYYSRSWTFTGLTNGVEYTFSVFAMNESLLVSETVTIKATPTGGITLPTDPCNDCPLCTAISSGETNIKGRILGTEEPSIFDALEVLKALVGMEGAISKCGNSLNAALITEGSRECGTPSIFDALEILKKLVGMANEIDKA